MKRYISWILSALILLSMAGCNEETKLERPVTFYYCAATLSHDAGSSAILSEIRESAQIETDVAILQAYLAGPELEGLRSPFPGGLRVVEFTPGSEITYITLTSGLANLTGLDLVMACACLGMTCMDLTGAEKVCIRAENALLGGEKSITMDKNSLLLLDQVVPDREK